IPLRAYWTPSSRDIASTPPLDAVYEICDVAEPITATNDATLTIDPLPAALMCRSAARQQRYTDVRLTSWTLCHAERSVVSIGPPGGAEFPVLSKPMPTVPHLVAAVANGVLPAVWSLTSTCTNTPPSSSAADSPAVLSMSAMTIVAPSARIRRPVASPIPLPP